MTSLTRNVWGREFDLEVRFEDWNREGILDSQWNTYGLFLCSWKAIDEALPSLTEYCFELDGDKIGDIGIDNIFRYVIPKYLFICRGDSAVALMCDYRFDPDHGLAIVFRDNSISEIGTQDIVL